MPVVGVICEDVPSLLHGEEDETLVTRHEVHLALQSSVNQPGVKQ